MAASIEPPIALEGPAREKWDELAARVAARPRGRPTDLAQLAAYCTAYARWRDAEAFLATKGPVLTIRDDKGNVRSHGPAPQLTIAERASKDMARLARLLGV